LAGLHWQLDLKAGTDRITVGCMDKAPRCFHDGSCDGEAEPAMRDGPLIRANKGSGISVRRLARFKDRTQQTVWNAWSVIFDVQGQPGGISGFAAAFPEVDMNASHAGHRFGTEKLTVQGLKGGNYAVKIDGTPIGTWTAAQLPLPLVDRLRGLVSDAPGQALRYLLRRA